MAAAILTCEQKKNSFMTRLKIIKNYGTQKLKFRKNTKGHFLSVIAIKKIVYKID